MKMKSKFPNTSKPSILRVFAGIAVSIHASLAIAAVALRRAGPLAGTQKACAPPADTRHIDALEAATKVGLDGRSGFDQLVFTDASGALVLVLQDAAGG